MKRDILFGVVIFFVLLVFVLASIEESRTFFVALIFRIFFFLKHNIVTLLSAFFLVKGKFIFTLFLKKIAILSATGIGKRYFIEKIINHNLKIHFFDYISNDIAHLLKYIKNNFKNFPIVKQIIAGFVFLTSLGFVGKFIGRILAVKVFVAKFWSFMLALILKLFTAITYFFTDYLWDLWIAPVVEVLLFSWILEWIEKIPFLKRYIQKTYQFFIDMFSWIDFYLERVFQVPLKRFFKFLANRIKKVIYRFMGYTNTSAWRRLQEIRVLSPNKYMTIAEKRKKREMSKKRKKLSLYKQMIEKKRL